jgi:uncharacterized protein YbbC (DUF1343 family)
MVNRVVTGLDRLRLEGAGAAGLRSGDRVGLLAHAASVDRRLAHAIDVLDECSLRLVRLFAPEHGIRGEAQDMEAVAHGRDATTGRPIRSLYGSAPSTLRPPREDLEELDAVIVDLQDVGSRYYTFVYTMAFVMEACGEIGLPVVVLDRPNPIGGIDVEGPVLDPDFASFVGRFAIPVRHGMTVLELANLFRSRFGVLVELRGIAMSGWRRRHWFDETGLPWVPPSPNMPTLDTATVYPGGCLVEGTVVSEGRGTTRPFEQVGAPWIDGRSLRTTLEREALPGVTFREVSFRPKFQKHAERSCGGVFVHVTDRTRFRPFRTYLFILAALREQAPDRFAWRTEPYEFEHERLAIDLLLGRNGLREAIESGSDIHSLEGEWSTELEDFGRLRSEFLLYPE